MKYLCSMIFTPIVCFARDHVSHSYELIVLLEITLVIRAD